MKILSIKNIRIIGFLSIVFMCLLPDVQGQKIGIGEWRDHLSYYQTKSVAVVGQEVYVMSPYGLFIYNQEDNIIERFSKINGLTDNGFTKLKYDAQQKCLMILYENSDIDIIKNGTIYNFPEIKLSSIIGNKGLNNVYFEGHFAYICCGFGVVVVDVDQLEVVETYRIGNSFETLGVYDMTADDTCFYVATAKGIFSARKDNPLLSFYESWHQWQSAPLINGFYSMIEVFDQRLTYVCHTDNVQQFYQQMLNDTIPQLVYQGSCSDLHVADGRLLLSTNNGFYVYQPSDFEHPTHFSQYEGQTINARQVEFSNNVYWIADENLGLLKATDVSSIKKMGRPNGPYSSNCFDLTAFKDQVWVSAGYYLEDSWYFGGSKEGTCSFDGSSWTIFNPEMQNVPDNSHDFCVAVVNPTNPSQAFVGTWGCGLYQFDNNELTGIYDTENSTLQPRSAAVNQGIFVSGLAFDSKGNLWVANSSCNDMLSCRSTDGTWRAYNLLVSANEDLRSLYIDANDQKWIITRYNELVVFKETENGNPVARRISVPGSEGGSVKVSAMAFDKNGTLWLGTNDGIVLLEDPAMVLEKTGSIFNALNFVYPKITWDGYTRLLLSGEMVTGIVVNGNNDKWISTKYSGLYKVSEFGTEQLEHFTAENSPLFSNDILDLCQTANGELFVGTANGIISYRDIATEGKEDNSEVYVFPNPVKPEYNGYIAITNVADKSYIKITDINGTLVYNTQANGGQAVWNGKNLKGQRVKTGVYLVFITNENGTEKEVTKIMFLN